MPFPGDGPPGEACPPPHIGDQLLGGALPSTTDNSCHTGALSHFPLSFLLLLNNLLAHNPLMTDASLCTAIPDHMCLRAFIPFE